LIFFLSFLPFFCFVLPVKHWRRLRLDEEKRKKGSDCWWKDCRRRWVRKKKKKKKMESTHKGQTTQHPKGYIDRRDIPNDMIAV
jgi:hypothetical protein